MLCTLLLFMLCARDCVHVAFTCACVHVAFTCACVHVAFTCACVHDCIYVCLCSCCI